MSGVTSLLYYCVLDVKTGACKPLRRHGDANILIHDVITIKTLFCIQKHTNAG